MGRGAGGLIIPRSGGSRGRRPATVLVLLAVALACLVDGCGGTTVTPPASTVVSAPKLSADGLVWLMTRSALAKVVADPGVAAVLAKGHVYELMGPNQKPVSGVPATLVQSFTSYAALQTALAGGGLTAGVTAVLYDSEHWSFTPLHEQQDFSGAMRQVAQLVNSHGLTLIAAPALTLTTVLAPGARSAYEGYLQAGLGKDAALADIVDVQAQRAERDAGTYAGFVRAAAAQIRAANPSAVVIAGLSTNPTGAPVTADQLVAAMRAVAGQVQGFWLNIPTPGPKCPNCNPPNPSIGIEAINAVYG